MFVSVCPKSCSAGVSNGEHVREPQRVTETAESRRNTLHLYQVAKGANNKTAEITLFFFFFLKLEDNFISVSEEKWGRRAVSLGGCCKGGEE